MGSNRAGTWKFFGGKYPDVFLFFSAHKFFVHEGEKSFIAFFPNSAKSLLSLSISVSYNFSSYGSVCSASACQTKEWVRISPSSDFFEKAEINPVLSGRLLVSTLIVLQNDGISIFMLQGNLRVTPRV